MDIVSEKYGFLGWGTYPASNEPTYVKKFHPVIEIDLKVSPPHDLWARWYVCMYVCMYVWATLFFQNDKWQVLVSTVVLSVILSVTPSFGAVRLSSRDCSVLPTVLAYHLVSDRREVAAGPASSSIVRVSFRSSGNVLGQLLNVLARLLLCCALECALECALLLNVLCSWMCSWMFSGLLWMFLTALECSRTSSPQFLNPDLNLKWYSEDEENITVKTKKTFFLNCVIVF